MLTATFNSPIAGIIEKSYKYLVQHGFKNIMIKPGLFEITATRKKYFINSYYFKLLFSSYNPTVTTITIFVNYRKKTVSEADNKIAKKLQDAFYTRL
jgi:hypothetical protein